MKMFNAKLMDYLRDVEKFNNRNPTGVAIAAMVTKLNVANIPNPEPQWKVLAPFNFRTLFNIIGYTSVDKLMDYQHLPHIIHDVRAGDREAIKLWVTALASFGMIKGDERDMVITTLDKTVPDPSWKEKVSIAEINFGRMITDRDICECCRFDREDEK